MQNVINCSTKSAPFQFLPVYVTTDLEYVGNEHNEKRNIETAIQALAQFSNFLKTHKLARLLSAEFGCHQQNTHQLVEHLYNRLYRYDFPFLSINQYQDHSLKDLQALQSAALVDTIDSVIGDLEARFSVKPLAQSNRRFIVPNGVALSTALITLYSKSFISQLHGLLTELERNMTFSARVFDVQQAIVNVRTFVDCVDGLIFPAKLGPIEDFVQAKLAHDLAYFIKGYPYDLLVSDKNDIATSKALTDIYAMSKYCSTKACYQDRHVDTSSYAIHLYSVLTNSAIKNL
jgi:hypothetical protein